MLTFVYPMNNHSVITLFQRMLNHVDPRLVNHGFRVAVLTDHIIQQLDPNCDQRLRRDLILVALLHDIGANKTDEIDNFIKFETESSWQHSIYGYLFLKYFSPLAAFSEAVLFHHTRLSELEAYGLDQSVIKIAQILNIADRADIFLNEGHSWDKLRDEFMRDSRRFDTQIVHALLTRPKAYPIYPEHYDDPEFIHALTSIPFTQTEIDQFVKMAIFAMDFRSRYTVTHTVTTATISKEIADRMGLSQDAVQKIIGGALLHDLGKIGIPVDILEYEGKLNDDQMSIMRTHVLLTQEILNGLCDDEIIQIALRHHEKLNGTGYPKGLTETELTLPQRIVAAADIVSALSGRRSYKKAYAKETTIALLLSYSRQHLIDADVTDCIIKHYDEILEPALRRSQALLNTYQNIQDDYLQLIEKYAS